MRKILLALALLFAIPNAASALCTSYPYNLTNGTTADATQVMANFNCAALTQGATVSTLTLSGITTFPGTTVVSSTGSLGVGTTTPQKQLVVGNDTTCSTTGACNPIAISGQGTGGNVGAKLELGFNYAKDVARANFATVGYVTTDTTSFSKGDLYFTTRSVTTDTAPSERMRITSGGSVGIATSSPSYTLHVNGSVAGTSAYNNLSDARLKKGSVPVSDGLVLVSQLQPVRFDWREQSERAIGQSLVLETSKRQIGFLAQDLARVLPEAVSVSSDDEAIMSVAETKLVPLLAAAIKELNGKYESQASEIAELSKQLLVLQQKLRVQTAQK